MVLQWLWEKELWGWGKGEVEMENEWLNIVGIDWNDLEIMVKCFT